MYKTAAFPTLRYINEAEVESLLMHDLPSYTHYIQERIADIATDSSSTWVKPKVIYDDPISPDRGDIRSMTCFTDRVKVVKIISTNPIRQKHWSVSVGATLLLDYEENHPIAMFDATNMSAIRTAAMGVVGALFANSSLKDTLIIGYGRVGSCATELVQKMGGRARVYDLAFKSNFHENGIDFLTNLERYEAKTIFTATTSRQAFLSYQNTDADFIVSVGADTAFNFELTPELIKHRGGLFVDCPDAAHVGDLSLMRDAAALIQGDIFDLYKQTSHVKTLVSVGTPLMDALTVEYMAKQLKLL